MLNGTNFKSWKEKVKIVLGIMDLDYAIREDRPPALTDASSSDEKRNFERWEKSNRIAVMIMKSAIPEAFQGTMPERLNAKEFLQDIEQRFVGSEKGEISTLLSNLVSKRYSGKGNIREYIMEMSHLASKLRALKLDVSEALLVHLLLISLPAQFSHLSLCARRGKAEAR